MTPKTAKQNSPKDLPLLPETVEAYSIAETAQRFGLSVQRVRKLVASGKLEGLGHRPSPTGLAYAIPAEAMEKAGYKAENPLGVASNEEVTQLRATIEKLELELVEARALATERKEEQARLSAELLKVEESNSLARIQLAGVRETVTRLEALAEAKTRESFLLEQALLRVPLALGTGSSWWQKRKAKKADSPTTTPPSTPPATPLS
jgi:hypothetical protein